MTGDGRQQVVVVGGGFCGLAAAYELTRRGVRAVVLERDDEIGGLAGSFDVGGERLEKFYHHWFTNDLHVVQLARDLGTEDRILARSTRTGMYFAHRFLKLSTPADVLRFTPLRFADRLRLGLLALRARRVQDWMGLEDRTAAEWLRALGGDEVFRVVWAPLLRGKFGAVADEISAVWMWNKLKLRGGSRGARGQEQLAYYRGGFAALADAVAQAIRAGGGEVRTGTPVTGLEVHAGRITGAITPQGSVDAAALVLTTPLPLAADLLAPHVGPGEVERLRRIRYLANVCIVLELDRSLSQTYWLNVNDPGFPFVGVIEHTNFEPASSYHGRHIVYLSKYLPETDELYRMEDGQVVDFTLGHLQRMFPRLSRANVLAAHVWRARWSQPIVERGYSRLVPPTRTGVEGVHLATMAQIYPEDRGTNYAIRQGRAIAADVAGGLGGHAGERGTAGRPGDTRPPGCQSVQPAG
ncbi:MULTISPECIES: NAD(P)/FAD-dependent oxidoreductase [Ramlibacter]|uniref:FAD-dependent oxidoreductase n=1 Tax=Ramlibacter pinisoli TaxID=2682844 RepID=A0A6N8IRC5_9BURK|nr:MULTISPECIES: NAD(P)/FAD-dependent oxidoreductase [Ramlibacter]MBA2964503.1 NAD(P)/FAD-dependent oxidoreductase [Ramlibacter sp. CGMCC 1.13660]MVQ29469.1 FAD-dependent oxidoreductase [Ramlibacter pinisoli]